MKKQNEDPATDLVLWYLSDMQLFLGVASTSTVVGLSTGALDGPLIKVPPVVTRKLLKVVAGFCGTFQGIDTHRRPRRPPITPRRDMRATRPT